MDSLASYLESLSYDSLYLRMMAVGSTGASFTFYLRAHPVLETNTISPKLTLLSFVENAGGIYVALKTAALAPALLFALYFYGRNSQRYEELQASAVRSDH